MTTVRLAHYGTNTLQTGDRIKLPEPLLKTLNIKKGQDVEILLDTEEGCIILKKPSKADGKKRVKLGKALTIDKGKELKNGKC